MAITYRAESKTFYLCGKGLTYAFFVNPVGNLSHLYCGAPIGQDDLSYLRAKGRGSFAPTVPGIDSPELSYHYFLPELGFYGTGDYREPAVLVENAGGDRLSNLLYVSHEILPQKPLINGMPSLSGGETLVVHLKDGFSNFGADLYYTVYDDASVIARRAVYRNGADTPVRLRRAYSFSFGLPGQNYDVMTLYGSWACERNIEQIPLHHGVVSVDSKRLTSSATLNPFMGLIEKGSTETHGNVWGVSLVYSSSFMLKAEGTDVGETLLTGGINEFDFSWKLNAGEAFETPEVVIAYSNEGIGGMSRAYHDVYRNHLIDRRHVRSPRPVVINNWEATYFDFDTDKLKAIADAVEGTGIDTLVLDDGWFGKRDNDKSGLGDWVVNTDKLKGGLTEIINHVHAKGMKFGLWFEPEMVSEDSDLFRSHPDYAIGVPGRARCYSRHQYMLDLTRPDVRDYIVNAVNSVLAENSIDYVKWDYNRNVTDIYSVGLDADRQSEFAHRYALGLYDICERIVHGNPNVFFEGCSGGGARFDPAMLFYFPQIWTSDDTDAEERTKIQYGTSIVYPLSTMSCHVSAVPNHQVKRMTALETRGHIAHLGATGYELDPTLFTEEEKSLVCTQVEEFKRQESLVQNGDLYRIDSPFEGNFFSEMIVSKDKTEALLVVYRRLAVPNAEPKRIRLAGLDPEKTYRIEEMNITVKGSTLMNVPMPIKYRSMDFYSAVYHIIEV